MGSRAEPIVAFGFNLGNEQEDLDDIADLIEAADNCEDGGWPVELVSHGYFDYRHFFLAVRGFNKSGGDWGSVLPASEPPPTAEQIEAAKTWCDQHKIKWQAPQWCAMASYG